MPLAGEFGQLARKNHEAMASSRRFSVTVWTIWLIPYLCSMLMGIPTIDVSANAAFGATLGAAEAISLALCLRRDERRAYPRLWPALSEDVRQRYLPRNTALAHPLKMGEARAAPAHNTHKARSTSRSND